MIRKKLYILQYLTFYGILFFLALYAIRYTLYTECFAQQTDDLEFTLDITSNTIPLPKIFKPNIDLSGRGFHRQNDWPQGLASAEVLSTWQKDIGFGGIYRLQYNLWEINQLAKDKLVRDSLLLNYENIIRQISEAGGIVILDIFSTPAGLGKVLDKKSAPLDLKKFKELIKEHIKKWSCEKRYNIWYEVWSAPDIDDFFLGRKQEYLNLYRSVAEAIKELEAENKIYIPLGGPSTSWWFQNLDGNTIITPERSLIYELIKFCYRNRLPLNFITWHGYSTDPKVEKEKTIYNKSATSLIRDWLTYFNLDRNIPLIVDEWNYDRDTNVLTERDEKSNICASYILSRIKNMYEQGIDYQLYFSLEDFQNNKEGVTRNTGVFWFDSKSLSEYKGGPKSIYNAFKMLSKLGNNLFLPLAKFDDEFVGIIASRAEDEINLVIYNYIDPEIFLNYLSRNISTLNPKERKILLNLVKSDKLAKIINHQLDISTLRISNKVKALLSKAGALNDRATKFMTTNRNIKIGIKNLKENYLYQRFAIDSSCSRTCEFIPVEEKPINTSEFYQEILNLSPYSVQMVILKKKPPQAGPTAEPIPEPSATADINSPTN